MTATVGQVGYQCLVYYLTQVAQIHGESTVRLPSHIVIRRPRDAISRYVSIVGPRPTYHLCRLDGQRLH